MVNNTFQKFCPKALGRRGQIAVIVIVFIVVLLAAFAVVLNLGKISQTKTMLTIAVDSSVSLMASLYASYAEAQYQGTIAGEDSESHPLTRAETAEWIMTAVSVIIAIVGVVLAAVAGFFTAGAGAAAVAFGVIAIISAVLSVAALVLQFAYIRPTTQNMWNKMFQGLTTYDRFREQGIQTLFGSSCQDTVKVADTGDYDMDGYYVGDGTPQGETKISRFSVLYTKRAEYLAKRAKAGIIGNTEGTVLYAWKDEDKPGQGASPFRPGKWHVVRAQVAVPMRCNEQCGRTSCLKSHKNYGPYDDNSCPEPFMPWIKKWSHDVWYEDYWSLIDQEEFVDGDDNPCFNKKNKRKLDQGGICGNPHHYWVGIAEYCRGLDTYKDAAACFKGGLVRAHVARYDEGGLNIASGLLSLWNMRFRGDDTSTVASDIQNACGAIMTGGGTTAETVDSGASYGLDGAFVLNEASPVNQNCWTLMHQLLNKGVEAESCAEYFCRLGSEEYDYSRFAVKFVACPKRNWP